MTRKAYGSVLGLVCVIVLAAAVSLAIFAALASSKSTLNAIQNFAMEIVLMQGILGGVVLLIKLYDYTFDKVLSWLGLNHAFISFLWDVWSKRRAEKMSMEDGCQSK